MSVIQMNPATLLAKKGKNVRELLDKTLTPLFCNRQENYVNNAYNQIINFRTKKSSFEFVGIKRAFPFGLSKLQVLDMSSK